MSSTYSLYMDTDLEPATALGIIMSAGRTTESTEARESDGGMSVRHPSGLWLLARNERPDPDDLEEVEEYDRKRGKFGFDPRIEVEASLADPSLYELQKNSLAEGVVALFSRYDGDAIVLFNGEYQWLKRVGNELALNSDPGEWPAERLELVTIPYTIEPLPIL